jgi:hypothetical protein
MSVRRDEPFEIQPRANGAMALALRLTTIVALLLAAGAVVLPGAAGEGAAIGAVSLVVAAPLLRVAWLAVRWVVRRDVAYAVRALGLLLIVVGSAAAALLQQG